MTLPNLLVDSESDATRTILLVALNGSQRGATYA